jgi:hypothetical protein
MLHPGNTAAAIERQPPAVVCPACDVRGSSAVDWCAKTRFINAPSRTDFRPRRIEKLLKYLSKPEIAPTKTINHRRLAPELQSNIYVARRCLKAAVEVWKIFGKMRARSAGNSRHDRRLRAPCQIVGGRRTQPRRCAFLGWGALRGLKEYGRLTGSADAPGHRPASVDEPA